MISVTPLTPKQEVEKLLRHLPRITALSKTSSITYTCWKRSSAGGLMSRPGVFTRMQRPSSGCADGGK